MQDAKAWRWHPTVMFGFRPRRQIRKLDVLLAEALRLYEDSLCKGCGVPAVWAWDITQARMFQLDPDAPQCNVCELIETPPAEGAREPGEKVRVLNLMFDKGGDSDG